MACCRLAFDLDPPGCSVLRYDCDYRQTFMELSTCDASTRLCTCGLGYCGYNVSDDGHMVCVDGLGAPCMACPRGSFKTTTSLAACEACALGYSTLNAGASRKEDCLPLCPNGTSSDTGFEVVRQRTPAPRPFALILLCISARTARPLLTYMRCQPCTSCSLGTFQPAVGRTSCLECPFGSNTTGLRSTSEVCPEQCALSFMRAPGPRHLN